jgi:hypothetical protein
MLDEPQPCFFQQVLGDVRPLREPGEEVVQPVIECAVHQIESVRIAASQARYDLEFEITIHRVHRTNNAELTAT